MQNEISSKNPIRFSIIFIVGFSTLLLLAPATNAQNPRRDYTKIYTFRSKVDGVEKYGYKFGDSVFVKPTYTKAFNFFNGAAYVETKTHFGHLTFNLEEKMVPKYKKFKLDQVPADLDLDLSGLKTKDVGYFFETYSNFKYSGWKMENLFLFGLESIRKIGLVYADYPSQYGKTFSGEGLLVARSIYSFGEPEVEGWLRKNVYSTILSSPGLRKIAWDYLKPYVKKSVYSMPPVYIEKYKDIGSHVVDYISEYDEKAVIQHLQENEPDFAYVDHKGRRNEYRKVTSFVDRTIVLHKYMNAKEARKWIQTIYDDVFGNN